MLTCSGCRVARLCSTDQQTMASKKAALGGNLITGRHKDICGVLSKWRQVVKGDVSAASCTADLVAFLQRKNTPLCPSARVPATSRLELKRLRKTLMRLCPAPRHTSQPEIACLACADCACAQRHSAVSWQTGSLRSPADPESTPVEKIVDCLVLTAALSTEVGKPMAWGFICAKLWHYSTPTSKITD
jgi:hypothetical protein